MAAMGKFNSLQTNNSSLLTTVSGPSDSLSTDALIAKLNIKDPHCDNVRGSIRGARGTGRTHQGK